MTSLPVFLATRTMAGTSAEAEAGPDMVLRNCLPGTPLHAMVAKALSKAAWQFYVGTYSHLDPPQRFWDRHRVGNELQNGDTIDIGATEMMHVLDATPPVHMTNPGEQLLRALCWALGDLNVMAQAVIDGETTWWYIEYDHSAGRIEAERRASATDYPERHAR